MNALHTMLACLQVQFEGITGSSYTGDVAIDQVKIKAKECTGKLFKMEQQWGKSFFKKSRCLQTSDAKNRSFSCCF